MKSGFIKFIIAMLVVAGLSQACFDGISHDVSESSVRKGRKLTTALTFAPMENEVDTKSLLGSRGEAVVYNWNLFVFEDGILVGKYYKEGQNGGPAGDIEFNVKLDYPYDFLAVANVGNRTGGFAPGATKAQVEAMTISNIDISSNGLPMSWSGSQSFTRAQYEANQAKLEVNMTRLVSKYEIVVNKSNLTVWSFEVTSLTMKGAGSVKPFSATGTNAGNSNSTVNDQATASDIVLMNGGSPAVFYPVENVFSTPSALSGNTDPWNKVPGNLSSGQYPSYIEMTATARLTDGTALSKTVTYRFYLGQDATKDFNVIRNTSNKITFSPDDETIKNGHGGNWKIEPGPFTDSRTLRFERQTSTTSMYRIKAGTSTTEGIIHTPSDFKYYVTTGSSHITMRNPSTNAVITSGSLIDLSSVKLDIQNGIEEQTTVHLQTMDGAKYDDLYLDIYNAYLEIIDPIPPVRNWVWNAAGSGTAQTFTVATSIDFTMDVPTGWTANKSLVSDINGEKTWTITVYPNDPSTVTTTPGESLPLKFKTTELDDVVATLTRDFKPQVSVQQGGVNIANLTWPGNESGEGVAKTVTVVSNEAWTIETGTGWDNEKWYVSATSGPAGSTNISIYPKTPNGSISDMTASFKVVPSRGTDAEKYNVSLTHQASAPSFSVSPTSAPWNWKTTTAQTITIIGNVSWTATITGTNADKFQISANEGSNGGTITVSPKQQNTDTGTDYSATLVFTPQPGLGLEAKNVTLSQTRHPSMSVSSTALNWAWTSTDNQTVTLTADTDWNITFVSGTVSQWTVTPTSGTNGTTITIRPNEQNDDTVNSKTATIRISGTDVDPIDITLTQAVKVLAPYLTPSTESLNWNWYEASTKTVTISSNKEWSYTVGGGDYTHFNVVRNGDVLSVTASENTDNTRGLSATISITCASNPELNTSVTLSQTKRPALSVSPTNLNWAWDATDGKSVTVTADSGFSWEVVNSNTGHYGTSTSGSTITVTPSGQNTDEVNAIGGTLTIRGVGEHNSDITATVTMNHEKKTSNFITATPGSLTFDDLANSDVYKQQITVSSNGAWSFDLPSGYNASTTSGSGNGSFYIWPTSKNNTYEDKSVTMTINGPGGVSANVTLIHEAIQRTLDHYEFSVSPSSFSLEWPGTTQSYSENIYPSITAVYISEHYEYSYEDEWVDGWTVDNISGNVGSHGEWSQPNTYSYRLTATNTNDTDWPSGTITLRYTGSSFPSLSGATASSSWEIQGKPTISLSPNQMTWDWDQSGNISGVRQNPNISSSGNDYFHPDNSDFVFTSNPGNIFDRGYYGIYPTSQNTDSSPRSGSGKISYVFHGVTIESNEITLTQTGKPAGPTYYDYTAAYVETYLSDYDIDEGESVTASAYVYEGTCHTTATSAPTDKSAYSWSTGATVTSSGFNSSKTSVATVSGSTVSGVGAGTSIISSKYSVSPSSYDRVFDDEPASLDVHAVVTTIYKVETNASPTSLSVGEYTTLSATLYSSTNGGSSWSVESTSPNSYSKVSGTSVINTSTGEAISTGSGTYRGIFNGYTVGSNDDVTITVSPAVVFDHYEYGNPSVSASASPNPIAYNGTSSQLSYSVSCDRWEYWTDGSYRNETTISDASSYVDASYSKKSGNTAFSVNSSSGAISVSANNTGDERSAIFTVTCQFKSGTAVKSGESSSGNDDVTVTQDTPPVNTYTAAYYEVSLGSSSIDVGSSTSVSVTLYTGSYSGTATSAPTSKSSYTWSSGSASAASSKTSVATVSGSTVSGVGAGSATISMSGWNPSSYDRTFDCTDASLTVNSSAPTLSFIWFSDEGIQDHYDLTSENNWSADIILYARYSDGSDVLLGPSDGVSFSGASGTTLSSGSIQISGWSVYATSSYSSINWGQGWRNFEIKATYQGQEAYQQISVNDETYWYYIIEGGETDYLANETYIIKYQVRSKLTDYMWSGSQNYTGPYQITGDSNVSASKSGNNIMVSVKSSATPGASGQIYGAIGTVEFSIGYTIGDGDRHFYSKWHAAVINQ